ncbi:MAG: extracellular solute-binding protein family 1 [Eubacterium sp.]|nr:extracellular solute-binding protein family 1 [Eubacterium sp.]
MKKASIKIICCALVIASGVSLFGCGSKDGGKAANNSAQSSGAASTTETEPPGEKVTLTVEIFDRAIAGYQADNNWQTKWIQENFTKSNPNIEVKFVPVLRTEEVDKLNVLMAANQAPDISFTYNESTIQNYVKNGGLSDLGSILDQNAPNLKKYLGDDLLSYGVFDGKQYAVPAKRVIQGAVATFIRKDWLDKLGLKVPTTTDEWYNCMKQFKEKDPGGLGDKNMPFSFWADPKNINFTVATLTDSFDQKITEEQRMTLPNWVIPGFKDGVKFLNKLYNEGIANRNFSLDKDGKQLEKDAAQGNVGCFIQCYDFPLRPTPGIATELAKKIPGAEFVACDPFTNYEGKHPKFKYNPNGLFLIVPKNSEHTVEAVKYLEWMSDVEVLKYLQNGVKGEQYTDEQNGIPCNFFPNDKLSDDKKYNFSDYALIVNGKEFGSDEKNLEAASLGYPGFEDQFKDAYTISMTDATYVNIPHFSTVIASQTKYQTTLYDKDTEIFVKSITSKPQQFDKTYDSLVEQYMKAGGQEIVDEKLASLKK